MMDCLITWWGWIDSFLTYDGLTPVVLVITLVFIIKYTIEAGRSAKETRRLAETTVAALQVDKDAFDLRQRPIVSVSYFFQNVYNFKPLIENRSLVHARVLIKASVVIDGNPMQFPEDSPYGGTTVWLLQSGDKIVGNMKFEDFMRQLGWSENCLEAEQKPAQVTFETWSVNFHSDPTKLKDDNSKGPVVQFDWSKDLKIWIPEVSPTSP